MLNRLFIIVGLIAILALGAAFVVPNFINWDDYRDRMQALASETLGAPVEITGEIRFTLLPQPQLNFSKVLVGSVEEPVMTVEQVEARFSLVDFFRDRYALTKLELNKPVFDLRLDANGQLETMVTLAEGVSNSTVSVASAQIVDGTVSLADGRTGETFSASNVDGELRIEAVDGPFSFQGTGDYRGTSYNVRLGSGRIEPDSAPQVSLFVQPPDQRFSLTADGNLQLGGAPSFAGSMTYRQAPAKPAADQPIDAGRGDLVIVSKVEANADRILLSDYTVTPDENRVATRLLGAAEIKLGAGRSFNAVISGTALALPPRDATVESAVTPYELVRLLGELSIPPYPGLPGTIGVDIAEINLRAVSLRNVRLDAEARDGNWQINGFSAQLPGNTSVAFTGALRTVNSRPNYSGRLTLRTQRLAALAELWRKPAAGNPLLGMDGALTADVSLVGETLSISNGAFSLDGVEHAVAAEIGFGSTSRHLNVTAQFAAMTADQSVALGALMPELSDGGAFALTFPKGRFDVALPSATVFDLKATNLAVAGSWEGGVVVVDRLAADDLGGATFDARLTAFGSFEKPELSGVASLQILSAGSPALARIFDLTKAPEGVRSYLGRSAPADLMLTLDAPSGEGGQALAITGTAATATVKLDAKVSAGFLRALGGPLSFNLDLRSDDAAAMTAQLGLGDLSLTPDDQPMHAVAIVEGTPSNSLEATLRIEGGADSIGFAGNVVVTDPDRLTGNGNIKATLTDLSALTDSLGAGGIAVPPVTGSAHVEFIGTSSLLLEQISATSGGQQFSGSLSLSETAASRSVTGKLQIGRFDPASLLGVVAGRQALLPIEGQVWVAGPFDTGFAARTTSGRISISSPAVVIDGKDVITDATFDLDWDATNTRIRQFAGIVGGGQATFDASICCAGPLSDKRVNGRMTLSGVELDAVVPAVIADALGGKLDAAAQFEATGGDLQSIFSAMTGQGSYAVDGLRIERLDPQAFAAAAALENVLDTDAAVLETSLRETLDDAPFQAATVNGSFTIAGGVIRSPNLAIVEDAARLFGSTSLSLADLGLAGGFVMTPTAAATAGQTAASAAQIALSLGGTLIAPERDFNVAGMIDAMKAQALELEVARLEKLRAEDEARRQAAAEERARIEAEEAAQRAAAAAIQKAADDAAARKREEEAARRRAEEERQRQQQTDILGPLDLGIN